MKSAVVTVVWTWPRGPSVHMGNTNLTLLKVDSKICPDMGIYCQAISDSLYRILQVRYHIKNKKLTVATESFEKKG